MKRKNAEELLYLVLRAIRFQEDVMKRQELQSIGESLIGSYKDLPFKKTRKQLQS